MIKTRSAKNKGKNLQNHVRDKILERFPWLQEGDVGSQIMGVSGVDVTLSPLGRETLPLSIECKKTKKTPNRAELQQSQKNAYKGTTAAVIWSPHGCGPEKSMIMFDFNEFLDFYEDLAVAHLTAMELNNYEPDPNL